MESLLSMGLSPSSSVLILRLQERMSVTAGVSEGLGGQVPEPVVHEEISEEEISEVEDSNSPVAERSQQPKQSDIDKLEIRKKSRAEFLNERKLVVAKLSDMRNNTKFNPMNTTISSQIKLTLGSTENPLNWNPGLHMNTDLYCEVIKYAMENQPDILEGIMAQLTDASQPLETDDITRSL